MASEDEAVLNDMHVSVTVPLVSNPSIYDSNIGQTSISRLLPVPHQQ